MQPGELFVVRDGTYKFRKLSPYDRAEAVRLDRDRRRQKLREELKDAEVDGEVRFETLQDFDEKEREKKSGAFFEVFDDPDGKMILLDLSVSEMSLPSVGQPEWKRRDDAAECIGYTATLDLPAYNELLASICNVYLSSEPAPESPEDVPAPGDGDAYDNPNPTEPATGTPATTT